MRCTGIVCMKCIAKRYIYIPVEPVRVGIWMAWDAGALILTLFPWFYPASLNGARLELKT